MVNKGNKVVRKTGMSVRKGLTSSVMREEGEEEEQRAEKKRSGPDIRRVKRRKSIGISEVRADGKVEPSQMDGGVPWREERVIAQGYGTEQPIGQDVTVWGKSSNERNGKEKRGVQNGLKKEKVRSPIPESPMAGAGQHTGNTALKTAKQQTTKGMGKAVKAGTAASGVATAGTTTAAVVAVEAAGAAKKAVGYIRENFHDGVKNETKKTGGSNASGSLISGAGIAVGFLLIMFVVFLTMLFPSAGYKQRQDQEHSRQEQIVARGQIISVAYKEIDEANTGGAKYKKWYGMNDNWCAMFVSWCADQCGYLTAGIMPKTASVAVMKKWYQDRNEYYTKESGYEPCAGDIIIFGNGRSHTGIVVDYDASTKTVTTVEGNAGSSSTIPYHAGSHVIKRKYPLTYRTIAGYGSPSYPEGNAETEYLEEMTESTET